MTILRLRIQFPDTMIGPGKADLLGHIQTTGSIAAAGRKMGMSYKRAWMLVEDMNAAFSDPLVSSTRAGPGGGGAQLTETGTRVLALYREILNSAHVSASEQLAALEALLRPKPSGDIPDGK